MAYVYGKRNRSAGTLLDGPAVHHADFLHKTRIDGVIVTPRCANEIAVPVKKK